MGGCGSERAVTVKENKVPIIRVNLKKKQQFYPSKKELGSRVVREERRGGEEKGAGRGDG